MRRWLELCRAPLFCAGSLAWQIVAQDRAGYTMKGLVWYYYRVDLSLLVLYSFALVTADGGNAPLGQGPAASPPPPSRPHTTTPFPNHMKHTPHHPCCEYPLVVTTV